MPQHLKIDLLNKMFLARIVLHAVNMVFLAIQPKSVTSCTGIHLVTSSPKENFTPHSANQASEHEIPHLPITHEQCQQLLALLKPQPSDEILSTHHVGT